MDISPASAIGLDAFSDADPLSNAGAYAGDVGSGEALEDAVEPRTSDAGIAEP